MIFFAADVTIHTYISTVLLQFEEQGCVFIRLVADSEGLFFCKSPDKTCPLQQKQQRHTSESRYLPLLTHCTKCQSSSYEALTPLWYSRIAQFGELLLSPHLGAVRWSIPLCNLISCHINRGLHSPSNFLTSVIFLLPCHLYLSNAPTFTSIFNILFLHK